MLGVAVLYGRSIGFGFVYDDRGLIELNQALGDWSTLLEALTHDLFHFSPQVRVSPYWRPVVTLSYYVDHAIGGGAAWAFHATNVLAFGVLGGGLFRLLRMNGVSDKVAALWVLLFVVHPVQVEGVANVAARTDVFCAAFGVWALGSKRALGAALLVEIGVVFGVAWWLANRGQSRAALPLGAAALFAAARAGVIRGWDGFDGGPDAASFLATPGRTLSELWSLLVPVAGTPGTMQPAPGVLWALLGWGALAAAGVWFARGGPRQRAGWVLLLLPLLAPSGFAVGDPREADGFAVVPLVGAVLLLSQWKEAGFSRGVQGGFLGVAVVLGALSQVQLGAWRSEESLWGWAHGRRPGDSQVRLNLSRTVVEERPQEALELLEGTEFESPRHKREADAVRAQAWLKSGDPGRAIAHLQAASALDPEAAWATGTGCVLMAPGGRRGAVSQCRLALELLPGDADVQNAMGIVLATRGQVGEALGYFQEAVRLSPGQAVFRANLERALSDPRVSGVQAGERSGD